MLKPEYTRPEVNLDDIADGADALMRELFSESEYSRDMKLIYSYVSRNGIEKFIYREILTYTDVIQINFSDRASETDSRREFLLRLAVVYFLHCRHNIKLLRWDKREKAELKELDNFLCYVIFRAAENCCPDSFKSFTAGTHDEKTFSLYQEIFEEVRRMSFVFGETVYEKDENGKEHMKFTPQIILRAPAYKEGNVQARISIRKSRYKEYTNYKECLLYLISGEGNAIFAFKSTYSMWQNAVKINRHPLIENNNGEEIIRNPHDIDLILFCLALGLNHKVYEHLKKLRDEYFDGQTPNKPSAPPIGDEEISVLEDFLKDASERLTRAAFQIPKGIANAKSRQKAKSRQMIIDASLDLVKRKMRPITILSDDERKRLLDSGEITPEILSYLYEEDGKDFHPDLAGNEGICKILLSECKFTIEALSLIKAKYMRLGLNVKGASHLRYGEITKDQMTQAGISEDIAELLTHMDSEKLKDVLDCASVRKKFGNI